MFGSADFAGLKACASTGDIFLICFCRTWLAENFDGNRIFPEGLFTFADDVLGMCG